MVAVAVTTVLSELVRIAVIDVVPTLTPVARPLFAPMVATEGMLEVQVSDGELVTIS